MRAETLADTLATALYAGTDDPLKTAPETGMLQRGDTCGWGRITALWFCILPSR